MKKKTKSCLTKVLFFIFCFSGLTCSKEKSISEILTSHDWQIFRVIEAGKNMNYLCQMDDCYRFLSDGTFNIQRGTNRCWENELSNGTYTLFSDIDILVMLYDGGDRFYYSIVSVEDNLMVLNYDFNGILSEISYKRCSK